MTTTTGALRQYLERSWSRVVLVVLWSLPLFREQKRNVSVPPTRTHWKVFSSFNIRTSRLPPETATPRATDETPRPRRGMG